MYVIDPETIMYAMREDRSLLLYTTTATYTSTITLRRDGMSNQKNQPSLINYTEIAKSTKFQMLMKQKNGFVLPMTIFFFIFYFLLPILTSYVPSINQPAIGAVTWAWIFGFAQFIMTWVLCMLYSSKAKKLDAMVEEIKQDIGKGVEM